MINAELPQALNVLLVEDNPGDAILIRRALEKLRPQTCTVQHADCLATGLRLLAEMPFDVVLLDRSLPDTTGFDGLANLQNLAPKVPIIILTAYADEATALSAVLNGAQDYLFKDKLEPLSIQRSINFAVQRKRFEETLTMRANFDPLTTLANRNLFENRLDMALARHRRTGTGLAVLLLDLDRFKTVNDTLGHAAGDQILQQAGERMKQCIRGYDTAARFGGDEFAILLDGVPQSDICAAAAGKIIKAFAAPFMVDGTPVQAGVSIGIATNLAGESISREQLLQRADEAMYLAKLTESSDYKIYVLEAEEPASGSVVRLAP